MNKAVDSFLTWFAGVDLVPKILWFCLGVSFAMYLAILAG